MTGDWLGSPMPLWLGLVLVAVELYALYVRIPVQLDDLAERYLSWRGIPIAISQGLAQVVLNAAEKPLSRLSERMHRSADAVDNVIEEGKNGKTAPSESATKIRRTS